MAATTHDIFVLLKEAIIRKIKDFLWIFFGGSDAPIRTIEYSLRHNQQQGVSDLWQSAPLTENIFSISTFNFVVIF